MISDKHNDNTLRYEGGDGDIRVLRGDKLGAVQEAEPAAIADVAGTIPAGGVGAAAGGWDTAANRDEAITTMTEVITQLNALLGELRAKGYIR